MPEPREPFVWAGQPLDTIGELLDAICAVPDDATAADFMAAYRAHTPHADSNAGYVIGYCGDEKRAELYERFGLGHPVFGRAV